MCHHRALTVLPTGAANVATQLVSPERLGGTDPRDAQHVAERTGRRVQILAI